MSNMYFPDQVSLEASLVREVHLQTGFQTRVWISPAAIVIALRFYRSEEYFEGHDLWQVRWAETFVRLGNLVERSASLVAAKRPIIFAIDNAGVERVSREISRMALDKAWEGSQWLFYLCPITEAPDLIGSFSTPISPDPREYALPAHMGAPPSRKLSADLTLVSGMSGSGKTSMLFAMKRKFFCETKEPASLLDKAVEEAFNYVGAPPSNPEFPGASGRARDSAYDAFSGPIVIDDVHHLDRRDRLALILLARRAAYCSGRVVVLSVGDAEQPSISRMLTPPENGTYSEVTLVPGKSKTRIEEFFLRPLNDDEKPERMLPPPHERLIKQLAKFHCLV